MPGVRFSSPAPNTNKGDTMLIAVTLIFASLFAYDNAEFFAQVKKERAEGYRFEYVGKKSASEFTHTLPVVDEQGKKWIYWQHKK